MIQIEIVLFIIASVLIVFNVIVWNWHKKVQRSTDAILKQNEITKLQIKKVEADEKKANEKYISSRDQLELDVKEYSNKPPAND